MFEELKYKEAQKPIIEAQKAKAKEFRKKAQDFKMSKMEAYKKSSSITMKKWQKPMESQ